MELVEERAGRWRIVMAAVSLLLAIGFCGAESVHAQKTLLNVSYDPTRELYQEFNAAFAKHWKPKRVSPFPSGSPTAVQAARQGR